MSTITKRLIFVGPADGANNKPLNVEGVAKVAHLPGTPVSLAADSSGFAAAAQGDRLFMVADKDQARSKSIDDAWVVSENMVAIQPRSGEFMNVLVAVDQEVVRGTPLTVPVAGGPLTIGTEDNAVCYADEIAATGATIQLVSVRVK